MIGAGTILGPDGRPIGLGTERVRLEKATRFNPLSNWTPDVLTRQLTAFCRGEIRDLAWVMEWLELHDDTISSVAPKAKSAVSRHGYDVVLKPGISPENRQLANDQRSVMQAFFDSIEVGHAVDGDLAGGMRLLVNQVMDGHGKGYGAHHLVWTPKPEGLRAKAIQVPLWFFEATQGRLRFLRNASDIRGVDLAEMGGPSAWMISRGRGVMLACTVARMFKQIPLQDWLTYCDRHGMPAFIGKTSAEKGSTGWQQLYEAVINIGSEYGAVMNTGDTIDVLNLTANGQLPYEKLIDRMDRSIITLWRGGDLSTISRGGGAVGAGPQQQETDDLDGDNAAWAAETIDRNLTPRVIGFHFGGGVPILVELQLRTATRQNVTQELEVVKTAVKDLSIPVSRSWFVDKFNLVLADDPSDSLVSAPPTPPAAPPVNAINSKEEESLLMNSLAKALGIRSQMLAPVADLIEAAEKKAQDGRISDADLLQFIEDAAISLPELFDPALADELGAELEAGMGTAAVQGARTALRNSKMKS